MKLSICNPHKVLMHPPLPKFANSTNLYIVLNKLATNGIPNSPIHFFTKVTQAALDQSLSTKKTASSCTSLLIYVDDIILIGSNL